MKTAARGAGLQGNITNHSVHKTSISRLMDAEVPVNCMAQPFAVFLGACIGKIEGCALVSFNPRLFTAKYFHSK